ncbi:ABC-2 type transport system permease protein [Roseivirga ehrenbergii]|uniref:ABC transporter permease n=1 Tax=Roseivirga ehrenbergii (strain DSM 102268 / JCM 13514 / KCTC 12282 / NCIMB 14502 / KMM 6017) TaxID=279360 RepID=A0A150XSN7_ROSEK|nr:DUF3526 domain-containing protein [Roseivirga ehrenbergii]KYG81714.1 hypothetical protein MB14_14130 [Roseivirga ehrenbergii]TCL10892.1 ABC-2 type transport system permease protein [Roseivirga ehrenbergii]
MSALLHIAKKEIRIAFRERLIVFLGIIIMVLLGISLFAGFVSYEQQKEIITKTENDKRQEWLNQGDKHPHIAAHYGTFAFKPKTVLSLFDFGLDAYTGTSVYLEAHNQHEFMFRPAQDHSSMIRFGELSSSLVLQVLLPLLIIFLSFSSYTKEKESGTLKLLMSQGVSANAITWGKILAYCIILLIMLMPFFVGLILIANATANNDSLPDVASRTALLITIYAIYLFLVITIAVWISMKSLTGRNALLTLLTFWTFFVILMPKTVANLSESFYPLPSMREFKAGIEESKLNGLDGQTPRSVRMAELETEYLEKYKVDSLSQLPFNFEGVSMQAGEDYGNMVYDHHYEGIRAIFSKQNRLGSIASIFNPFIATQHLSMSLSGTDLHTFNHFENEVEEYRRMLVRRMNNDMAENSKYGEFYEYAAGEELWEEIDGFYYTAPTFFFALRPYYLELLSLLAWVVFTIFLLKRSNKKLKPIHG